MYFEKIFKMNFSNGINCITTVEFADNIKRLKAPEFVAKPHSTITLEGSVITLDCAAVGNPRPQISWLKDGTLIDVA